MLINANDSRSVSPAVFLCENIVSRRSQCFFVSLSSLENELLSLHMFLFLILQTSLLSCNVISAMAQI